MQGTINIFKIPFEKFDFFKIFFYIIMLLFYFIISKYIGLHSAQPSGLG